MTEWADDTGLKRAYSPAGEYVDWINSLDPVRAKKCWATAISLYCGGGGLDLGLSWAGVSIMLASDLESTFCDTISKNLPETGVLSSDVTELRSSHIREITKGIRIDIIVGGPPCQAFSILGKRGSFKDPRGKLIFEFVRLIKELRPRAFLFENVPGLLTLNRGNDWQQLLKLFREETGYVLHAKVLNSADFGVPQIRKRVFVVGLPSARTAFQFPEATHESPAERSLFGIGKPAWLPCDVVFEGLAGLPNHDIREHGSRVRSRYEKTPQGGRDKTDHSDRLELGKPAGTVLVGSKAGGGRPHIHPIESRVITVREAARLQSFPDWYAFEGTSTAQYRQVGNAVPPLLARAVGFSLREAFKSR